MVIEVEKIIPPYDRARAERFVREGDGKKYSRKVSKRILFPHMDRVSSISPEDPCLFLVGHTAMKDYPISQYSIMRAMNFPSTRMVGGTNLNNWLFRGLFGLDFSDFGMFWYDKDLGLREFESTYFPAITQVYQDGESLCVFPEGTRNRNPENGPLPFKKGFIRGALAAQEKLGLDTKLVCVGLYHEKRPDEDFYWLTDRGKKGGLRYFLGDTLAFAKGRWARDKGTSVVGFAEPISLRDVAGSGSLKEQARNVAYEGRMIIADLYDSIRPNE